METELLIPVITLAFIAMFLLLLLFMPGMRSLVPYLYLNARIAVKEGKLIKPALYQEILNAHSIPEIAVLLQETPWSASLQGTIMEKADALEKAVTEEMVRLYRELQGIMPTSLKATFVFLSQSWDVRNIKAAMRSLRNPTEQTPLVPFGALSEETLRRMAEADDREHLLSLLKGTRYAFLMEYFQRNEEGEGWEDLLERFVLEENWKEVISHKHLAVLRPYFAAKIDAVNLATLLRGKSAGTPWDELDSHIIKGGDLLPLLERNYETSASAEELIEALREYACYEFLASGLDDLKSGKGLFAAEKGLREYVLKVGRDAARLHPYGPAPVAGFLARKEAEAANIRAIAKGKEVGLKPEEIAGFLLNG